jgi:hypothetical protein
MTEAMRDLAAIGYAYTYGREKGDGFGASVEYFRFKDSEDAVPILLQTRSHQKGNDRYWIGFMPKDLEKVDLVAVWLQNEAVLFIFPAPWLKDTLLRNKADGKQWKADINVGRRTLSPQSSGGASYDISAYAVAIPRPPRP